MLKSLNKRSETVVSHEKIVAGLVDLFGTDLITAVEYGKEPSLKKLTGCEPSLFVVIADSSQERIGLVKSLYSANCIASIFVVTETEANLLPLLYPIELIHIRSGYALLHGDERLLHVEINRDPVITQLIRELLALTLQIRRETIAGSGRGNHSAMNVMRRMIPVIKGLLSLRLTTIPVDWASLVSDLESSYNLKQFPLSGMVAALEKNPSAQLELFFTPLLQILDDLRNQLIHTEGSVA